MKLPPALNKKMAGLPLWAWLALGATGVGVGLILRSRSGDEEGESTEDPCDPESPSYDPVKCESVGETGLDAGYDTGDPCDPMSVTYDPSACQATAGIGYNSAGGGGGPSGYQIMGEEPYPSEAAPPLPDTPRELTTAEEGGIDTDAPLVQITQNIRQVTPKGCDKKRRPKNKKGFKVVCDGGRWSFEPNKHASKKGRNNQHAKMTGGGAPHKRNNKGIGHGKKKHKAKR